MIKPYTVVWLDERCVLRALDTRRGRRKAVLLVDGQAVAVLKVSDPDWQAIYDNAPPYASEEGRGDGQLSGRPSDNGRSARTRAARRPGVGMVSSGDTGAAEAP